MSQQLLQWETIDKDTNSIVQRARVPGGWLVMVSETQLIPSPERNIVNYDSSICFVPDPLDAWQPQQDNHS